MDGFYSHPIDPIEPGFYILADSIASSTSYGTFNPRATASYGNPQFIYANSDLLVHGGELYSYLQANYLTATSVATHISHNRPCERVTKTEIADPNDEVQNLGKLPNCPNCARDSRMRFISEATPHILKRISRDSCLGQPMTPVTTRDYRDYP